MGPPHRSLEALMTEHAKSDPSTDRRRPAAPPPPPAWRNWLLVAGLIVSVLILFWPQREPSGSELSYTEVLSRGEAGGSGAEQPQVRPAREVRRETARRDRSRRCRLRNVRERW